LFEKSRVERKNRLAPRLGADYFSGMGIGLIRKSVRNRYAVEERGHACAILAGDFKSEFKDLMDCLDSFTLTKSHITKPGGNRSTISIDLDSFFFERGWTPKAFDTKIVVNAGEWPVPTCILSLPRLDSRTVASKIRLAERRIMKRIVVEISGGVLTDAYCHEDDTQVVVIDWDNLREKALVESPVCILDAHPLSAMPTDTRDYYERAVAQ